MRNTFYVDGRIMLELCFSRMWLSACDPTMQVEPVISPYAVAIGYVPNVVDTPPFFVRGAAFIWADTDPTYGSTWDALLHHRGSHWTNVVKVCGSVRYRVRRQARRYSAPWCNSDASPAWRGPDGHYPIGKATASCSSCHRWPWRARAHCCKLDRHHWRKSVKLSVA
jgi:hypothetical protein